VWNDVKGFDLYLQVGVDVMHDVLEGVSKYILCFILISYIDKFNFFSLKTLNDRLISFPYGPDAKNKPVPLSMDHLKNGNVRQSASEMLTILRYLGLLIGEFVPENNAIWSLFITLRKIVDILLATYFITDSSGYLQTLVSELNKKYCSLTKDVLKPKFHNLIHYHSAMERFGPLVHIWSMRFEAKHRPLKIIAKSSCNKQNITLTLAKKHQLQLNGLFCKGSLEPILKVGPVCPLSTYETENVRSQLGLDRDRSLLSVAWASVSTTCYKKGLVLADSLQDDGYLVNFFTLNKIYLYNSKILILFGDRLKTVCFEEHLYAYEVQTDNSLSPVLVTHENLLSPFPNAQPFHVKGKYYVVLRNPV